MADSSELKINNFNEEQPSSSVGSGFNASVINNSHTQSHTATLSFDCSPNTEFEVYKAFTIGAARQTESGTIRPGINDFTLRCPPSHPVYKRTNVILKTPGADVLTEIIPGEKPTIEGIQIYNTNRSMFGVAAAASVFCGK
ncbi:hypothetical protein [Streptomyces sp. NPDC088752]|uniref:hypothetical protein n=1 Tax=Streptomyces sp. NPDC088752 TaxID=3154963 RepID=UPI00342A2B2B